MQQPIETVAATGSSPYAIIHQANGQVWNTTLNAGAGGWENYNSGHWAQYAIPLVEQAGSGYYRATYPAAISGVVTTEVIYDNATPTLGDVPVGLGQSQGENVVAVFGDATVPAKLQGGLAGQTLGAAVTGTLTAAAFTTNVVNAAANAYRGRALYFFTGALAGQGGIISTFDPITQTITVAGAFTAAPANGDQFLIS